MTDANSESISMDELFAALGSGGSSQTSSSKSSKGKSSSADVDDALADLFNLVGDSAVAAKRAQSPKDEEDELDLFAALNIDVSSKAKKKASVQQEEEYASRLTEREDQIREQQIRSQQWQRELEAREDRLRRAEQARINEAEAKIRREQEASALAGEDTSADIAGSFTEVSETFVADTPAVTEVLIPEAPGPLDSQVLQEPGVESTVIEAAEYEAAMRAQAEAQAIAQAAAEAQAQQAQAEAEARVAAEAQALAQAQAQAQQQAHTAQIQAARAAEEAERAEALREAASQAATISEQPTQEIKTLSEANVNVSKPSNASNAALADDISKKDTADLEPVDEPAEADKTVDVPPAENKKEAPAGVVGQVMKQPQEGWERKIEPVKRAEDKHDDVRPEPTKRSGVTPKAPLAAEISSRAKKNQVVIQQEEVYSEPVSGGKLGNVIGVILILIAIVCIVLTVLLFTGTITRDTFVVNGASSNKEMPSDEDVSNVESSNQAMYSYVVRGVNGETHEAVEVATFGEDGKLTKSSIEISVPNQDVADALLEQLKSEFAEKVESSSATPDKVTIVVLVPESGLDKNGYTELLASTMTGFKDIKK